MQRTLIIIKPDAIQRGLAGTIVKRFEQRGLKIVAMKMAKMTMDLCKEHYAHLVDKPFFPKLAEFMMQTPVIFAVLEGKDAVQLVRDMMGPTNCRKAMPGTIRGDFGQSMQSNLIHGSDSPENAEKEIKRFFSDNEIFDYKSKIDGLILSEEERQ